jgi:hypothetical protein
MSQDRINAQLKGLQHASPLFRRQAAFGVFALLQGTPAVQPDTLQDVLLTCLTNSHPVSQIESIKSKRFSHTIGNTELRSDTAQADAHPHVNWGPDATHTAQVCLD